MDWLEVTNSNNEKVLINANAILDVSYKEETNLTIINFIRSAYPSAYIKGNVTQDIKRHFLCSHGNNVGRIGD